MLVRAEANGADVWVKEKYIQLFGKAEYDVWITPKALWLTEPNTREVLGVIARKRRIIKGIRKVKAMDKILNDMILRELTDLVLKDLKDVDDKLNRCSRKKHKTVQRKKPIKRFDRKPIFRPGKWSDMMDRPAIGDRIFIATLTCDDDIDVVESKFSGTNAELLMLAQGRLFFDRSEAEMYIMHCKALIAAMRAQLPELEADDEEYDD